MAIINTLPELVIPVSLDEFHFLLNKLISDLDKYPEGANLLTRDALDRRFGTTIARAIKYRPELNVEYYTSRFEEKYRAIMRCVPVYYIGTIPIPVYEHDN